jgi:septal ring factor EnvC (AmiA/AmiB activator)
MLLEAEQRRGGRPTLFDAEDVADQDSSSTSLPIWPSALPQKLLELKETAAKEAAEREAARGEEDQRMLLEAEQRRGGRPTLFDAEDVADQDRQGLPRSRLRLPLPLRCPFGPRRCPKSSSS